MILLVLLLLWPSGNGPRLTRSQIATAAQDARKLENDSNPPGRSPIPDPANNMLAAKNDQKARQQSGQHSEELWLIGVGIATALFVAWQAFETQKAAAASRHSAEASEKNAIALVNSQRAWVMVDAQLEQGAGVAYSLDETNASVELSIWNSGPTPAWVYEQYVYLKLSPDIIASRTEYPMPDFPYTGDGSTGMKGHVNYEIHPIANGQAPITWKAWVQASGFASPDNGLHMYIFGVVRYRDAFSATRETYFGYRVVGNKRLERIPNEAYNKHK